MAIGGIVAGGGNGRGRQDVRFHLGKKRVQDLLRKHDILDPLPETIRGGGEIDAIRAAIGQGEGFTMPVNFEVSFNPPQGLHPVDAKVNPGGLDHQTHIMNHSQRMRVRSAFNRAATPGVSQWNPNMEKKKEGAEKQPRKLKKIDIYCSKVSIPQKSIGQGLYRHYGPTFAYPNQAPTYGTMTTTFYCDETMQIKKFFDVWQTLIYNTQTGNFNYYNEYTSSFDVFTRSTIAAAAKADSDGGKKKEPNWAQKIQSGIHQVTKAVDEFFGTDANTKDRVDGAGVPRIEFNRTYGCRIFECWPQTVGQVDLSHDGGGNVATFDVTWAYHKWSPFKMEGVGSRRNVNLNVGLMRNEKDGIPFIEDLPPELAGPLGGAVQQAFNTSPLSKGSNIFG